MSLADTSDLVLGRLFCCCCCVTASRNPVETRNHIACSGSIEQLLLCWKNMSTCITCASSMSFQSCQLMWHSCSNPVHINHQHRTEGTRTHAGVSQSPQFPCSQRITSIKSVSFATRAEKAGILKAPQPLCEEDSLVGDAAVLRLPGILSLPGIMLPVTFPGKNEQSIEQLSWCHAGRI